MSVCIAKADNYVFKFKEQTPKTKIFDQSEMITYFIISWVLMQNKDSSSLDILLRWNGKKG